MLVPLLALVSLYVVSSSFDVGRTAPMSLADAYSVIKEYIQEYSGLSPAGAYCELNHDKCCTIAESKSGCSLGDFADDVTSIVYTGGETTCIFGDKYNFQVVKGDSDKLLFYFQGGGACWDKLSTDTSLCTTTTSPQPLEGLFDRSDSKDNEYKDFTIVHVSYCSGDLHAGNITRSYTSLLGKPVVQSGQANTMAVLDWVKSQQARGSLSPTLSKIVVSGCSAGSIGAQIWGSYILDNLKWATAAVMPDSYIGVFPKNSQGPLIESFGMCGAAFLSANMQAECRQKKLTLQQIANFFMKEKTNVPFAYIQSKIDSTQQAFYVAIGLTEYPSLDEPFLITPSQFYDDVNEIMSFYNERENFITYLVDGTQHCFTPKTLYYTADSYGPADSGANDGTNPMLFSWANNLPLQSGEAQETVCQGDVTKSNGLASAGDSFVMLADNTYCSDDVVPKTFTA